MRKIKDILKGEFDGEDIKVKYFRCPACGYANKRGKICEMCGNKNCEEIK